MKIYETNMTNKEVKTITKAYSSQLSTSLFLFIFSATILILLTEYHKFEGTYVYIAIIIGVFSIIYLYKSLKLLFLNPIRKDIQEKRKVRVILIVERKEKGEEMPEGNDSSHTIYFKNNPFLYGYNIPYNNFIYIKVGDKVTLEFSKYGKWIIKVNSPCGNIKSNANKSFI